MQCSLDICFSDARFKSRTLKGWSTSLSSSMPRAKLVLICHILGSHVGAMPVVSVYSHYYTAGYGIGRLGQHTASILTEHIHHHAGTVHAVNTQNNLQVSYSQLCRYEQCVLVWWIGTYLYVTAFCTTLPLYSL